MNKNYNNCFIVAEISGNHNGKIEDAKKLIRYAKQAGADAVKIQTYTADTITLNAQSKDFKIKKNNPWFKHKYLWSLYNKAQTPFEWTKLLFNEAKKNKIKIFSSVFDETSIDQLEKLNCPLYKVASPEINHIPLLKKLGKTKKPIIISTGLADKTDLSLAVKTLKRHGTKKLTILKCTSEYPSKYKDLNLKTMIDYKNKFDCDVGFSDHTKDNLASIVAVSNGASVIEKHMFLKSHKSVDSFFSLDQFQFRNFVNDIRNVEKILGKIDYSIIPKKSKSLDGKRSIYASKKILKGELINSKNIKVVRPRFGLHPKYYFKILNKKAKKNILFGERLSLNKII